MSLMTLIITDVQQSHQHLMEPELFQAVLKVKLESGKFPNRLKSCKPHLRNTEAEFGQFKLVKTIHKLFQQVVMVHVLFGTLNLIQDYYVSSNQQPSNKLFLILKNIKF